MCDLDSFHDLTLDGQLRVIDRVLADRTPEEHARAARRAQTLSLSLTPASPSRDALPIPSPGLAGVGDSLLEQNA